MKYTAVFLTVIVLMMVVSPVFAQDSPLPTETPGPVSTVAPDPTPTPEPPAPEDRTLENLLSWIVSGGCGVLAFFVLEKFAGTWFHDLTPEVKQYLASGISGGLAVLAFIGLVGLNVEDSPGEALAWIDILTPVFFVGAGFANLAHSRFVLSGKSTG